eukprot:scaffold9569_cov142-Isochrysis_galbana.AAC.2
MPCTRRAAVADGWRKRGAQSPPSRGRHKAHGTPMQRGQARSARLRSVGCDRFAQAEHLSSLGCWRRNGNRQQAAPPPVATATRSIRHDARCPRPPPPSSPSPIVRSPSPAISVISVIGRGGERRRTSWPRPTTSRTGDPPLPKCGSALGRKTVDSGWLSGVAEAFGVALWLTMLPCAGSRGRFGDEWISDIHDHDDVGRPRGRRSSARVSGQVLHANLKIGFASIYVALATAAHYVICA